MKYIADSVSFFLLFVSKLRKWAARASGEGVVMVEVEYGHSRDSSGDLRTLCDVWDHD